MKHIIKKFFQQKPRYFFFSNPHKAVARNEFYQIEKHIDSVYLTLQENSTEIIKDINHWKNKIEEIEGPPDLNIEGFNFNLKLKKDIEEAFYKIKTRYTKNFNNGYYNPNTYASVDIIIFVNNEDGAKISSVLKNMLNEIEKISLNLKLTEVEKLEILLDRIAKPTLFILEAFNEFNTHFCQLLMEGYQNALDSKNKILAVNSLASLLKNFLSQINITDFNDKIKKYYELFSAYKTLQPQQNC